MPILAMSAGRVTAIWGNAYIRQPDGSLKALQVGDRVPGGARVITEADGIVEISPMRGPAMLVKQAAPAAGVDKAIRGLESQDPEQVPAAGLAAGGNGSLTPGLRVDRVNEPGTAQDLHLFDAAADRNAGQVPSLAVKAEQDTSLQAVALPDDVGVRIDDVVINEAAGTATFTVTLDAASTRAVEVHFETVADSASDTADFRATSGQLVFQPGETSRTVSVPILNEGGPGLFEGDAEGQGRERFFVKLSDPVNAVLTKVLGEAVIRDDGTGALQPGQVPDDDRPRVSAVEVLSTDAGHVYFSVRVDNASEFPVPLKLEVSPGNQEVALGDLWTGSLEYALLDAMPDSDTAIPFEPWLNALTLPHAGQPDPSEAGGSVVMLSLPPLTPAGVIIVKVPLFVAADSDLPYVDRVKLQASTEYDSAPQSDEASVPHAEIDIAAVQPVWEGQSAVFDLSLSHALDRALPVKLSLLGAQGADHNGEADADVAGETRDVHSQLYVALAEDGPWQAVGDDGIVVIPAELAHVRVRVDTVDDARLEADEAFRLGVSGMEGGAILTSSTTAAAIILDDDSRFDPVTGTWLLPEVSGSAAPPALDPRDLVSMDDVAVRPDWGHVVQSLVTPDSEVNATEIYIAKSDGFTYSTGIFDAISQAAAAALREVPNRHD